MSNKQSKTFKRLCETCRSAQAEMFAAEAACDWKALRAAEKRVLHLRFQIDLERNRCVNTAQLYGW